MYNIYAVIKLIIKVTICYRQFEFKNSQVQHVKSFACCDKLTSFTSLIFILYIDIHRNIYHQLQAKFLENSDLEGIFSFFYGVLLWCNPFQPPEEDVHVIYWSLSLRLKVSSQLYIVFIYMVTTSLSRNIFKNIFFSFLLNLLHTWKSFSVL
jgi:hypothetical protein